jgi:2-aminoadipate transaminase
LGKRDALAREAASQPDVVSFAGGLPDPALFPARALGRALESALHGHVEEALQYGWPEGSEALRAHVARSLVARGAKVSPAQVIITSGAQQALSLSLAALSAHATIGVDREPYPGALDIFRAGHASLGSLTDAAHAYYVMPSLSNPRGQRMSSSQRRALLGHAAKQRAFVIEDDAYEGTWFANEPSTPLLAEAPERVFHIGTFSKTLCPGLRIGWLVPPPKLLQRVLRKKQSQDLQANGLAQALLVRYLEGDQFARHQRRSRLRYRRKAAALTASVSKHLPDLRFDAPRGGFSLWLEGDFALNQNTLLAASIKAGVAFDPGYVFRRERRSSSFALRLCYSAVPEADIDKGIRRLASALDKLRRRRR